MVQTAPHRSKHVREKRRLRKEYRAKMAENKRNQIRELRELFVECDDDKTGMLTNEELTNFLGKCNQRMGEGELKDHELTHALNFALGAADTDNDGGIAFEELVPAFEAFNNWTLKNDGMREQVRELMGKHDADDSGSLDREELVILLSDLNGGKNVDQFIFDRIWSTADANNDGRVDLEELAPALSRWDQGDFDIQQAGSKYAVGTSKGGNDGVHKGTSDQEAEAACCVLS